MRNMLRRICLLSAAAVLLTGCGQTAGAAGGSGTLHVGVRDDIVGFGYLNPDTEEYYGLEIDLAKELARELGYADVEFAVVNPENRKAMLADGNVDCLISMYSIEETRLENFDFSPSYYTDHGRIMVEKSSMMDSIDDLVGKKIGVLEGANAAPKLAGYMKELGLISDEDVKDTSLVYKDTYAELSDALEVGEVDAICVDGGIARAYQKDDRKILDEEVTTEQYGVATQKDSELSGKMAAAVQKLLDDGTLTEIIDKWD